MAVKRGFEALRALLPLIAFLLILIMQSSRNEAHSRRFTITLSNVEYIFAYILMSKSQYSLARVNGVAKGLPPVLRNRLKSKFLGKPSQQWFPRLAT